ncbi:MAG TPA: extracellular solute-binding protein [Methylomirabilota bacterium]|jgi:multiple sugar transport system substrate-binding protein|nr:extracellular solute-binding protein [Methylomirabilota bacterium]
MSDLSRRQFLGRAAAGTAGLAGILAAKTPPAVAQQREISYLCWNNFAPASDKKLAEIGQRFAKDTGIKIKIDHIAHPQQAAKYASEVQSQAGHDLIEMRMHFPWLYETQLVEVSDLVAELEKKYGKALSSAQETANVRGVWRAVPQYHTFFVGSYREDLFKKAGLKVPDTWEDLYTVGKELKKMGHPVGIPISQNYDTISTAGPVLWSLGGMEIDRDGKTVRISSPATEQMIEWYKKMFRDCMEPEVLSWTDASNNDTLNAGKAGWIHNPISAYIVARNRKMVTADGINHHRSLAGPHGRHETDVPRHIGIWKFSKNVEPAKEWIRYLLAKKDVYDEYIMSGDAFNLPVYASLLDHPVLKTDPKFAALKQEGVQFHAYGWPAPPSDKVQRITNEFILPNMIAKAVTGTPTKEAIAWAEKEMKRIISG